MTPQEIERLIRRLEQHALPDPHDEREVMHAPLLREAAAALRALTQTQWVAVEERLPEPGVKVIAYYVNSFGKSRRIRAEYVAKHSREDNGEFQGDTDNTEDNSYWPEGWYETNEFEETSWFVHEDVTHWMPLPPPPSQATPSRPLSEPNEQTAVAVPEGYVVVPREPTMGQWDDFTKVYPVPFAKFMEAYKAMLSAVAEPKSQDGR